MKKTVLKNWQQTTNAGCYEGESIETKCRRIVEEKTPITDGAPIIYTPKEQGVLPAYDIRTDKWDMAILAMDAVNKQKIAQSKETPKDEPKNKNTEDPKEIELPN